jgi:hypothetical protein
MDKTAWRGTYRVAAIALTVAATSYIVLLGFLISTGGLPTNGQQMLDKMAEQGELMQVVMVLFIVKDLCVLVTFPALFKVLEGWQTTWPLVATALGSTAMVLDIISSLIVFSLPSFADAYAAAPAAEKPAYLVSGEVIFRYIWIVETPFMVAILSVAVALFSVVMYRILSKPVAVLGVALGAIGVVAGLLGFIQPILLMSVWYGAVGVVLYRYANRMQVTTSG